MSHTVTILYFAWLRPIMGLSREQLVLPDGVRTIADLAEYLSARSPAHAAAFRKQQAMRCALNQEFADVLSPVHPGDEVAFFPAVTGG